MSIEEKIMKADEAAKKKKKIRTLGILVAVLILVVAAVLFFLFNKKAAPNLFGDDSPRPTYMNSIYANLDWPIGAAVNADGSRVYVVDSNHRQVKYFNAAGTQLGAFGKELNEKSGGEGFLNPLYVAVNPKGEVYVTDRSAADIQVYSANGKYISRYTPKVEQPDFSWSPLSLTFDKDGKLYVVDAKKDQHRVLVFDKTGKFLFEFGKEGTGEGEFEFANGIAVKDNGDIYVADSNNSRVQVFSKDGKYKMSIGKGGKNALGHPVAVGFDGEGRLHVSDTFGHAVSVFDDKGKFLYKFGSYGAGDGQFMFPMGLAVHENTVYVVDREGKRIEVWEY